jgi:antitoxin (DNA-binding transcriptional repressor) of toxin-antitoxin stability system
VGDGADEQHVDNTILGAVMAEFLASAKSGEVVYLSEHGVAVAAVVPLDVAEAGLRALGRA